MKINISTRINKIQFFSCIMNASGALCRTKKELLNINKSSSGAIVTKSCTNKSKKGNPFPRYFDWSIGSINSMGVPNLGIDFYLNFSKKEKINKPFFLSILSSSIEENYSLIKKANLYPKVSAIELNISCPNIIGKNNILGYDFNNLIDVIKNIFQYNKKPLGLKLPPYFERSHIKKISSIINNFPISFITCINSLSNGMVVNSNEESSVIYPNNGFGGIGGVIIKPFALANIFEFYSLLRKEISIIGCGGISSGQDIFDHILCGASAVQVGTQLIKEGISVFDRLEKEFISLMKKKKYSSIKEFRGNLKRKKIKNY